MTEKETFFAWLAEEREKGLLGFNVTGNLDRDKDVTEEEIYGELNRMIAAPAEEVDLELFPSGKSIF